MLSRNKFSLLKIYLSTSLILTVGGCTFNFELTSQRTALENQVMGSYKELDDELVLTSSVRGPNDEIAKGQAAKPTARQRVAIDARQNQEFNRDDIDEFKSLEALGELASGKITVMPEKYGNAKALSKERLKLAEDLVKEENADRAKIWQRIIEANPNLSAKDLPAVQQTYAKMQRDQARPGQWIQDEAGVWQKKVATAAKDVTP